MHNTVVNIGSFLQVVADSPTLICGDIRGGWRSLTNPNYSVIDKWKENCGS